MKYLDSEEILLIHHQLIERYGGAHGTRDLGRIKSVSVAPAQHVFGEEQYKNIFDKAAVYARNLIVDHPFYDGNKRTGITCSIMFLKKNGYHFKAMPGEVEKIAIKIAVQQMSVPDIGKWLKAHCLYKA
jgi:death-on-curing protein